jgi:signal transduction histidine kinase
VQEALANAARHSGAPLARVVLAAKDGVLRVVVDDEGHGFDPADMRATGLGLAGMRERAALLGAHLRVESAPGRGTRVALEVPLTRSSGEGA